MTYASYSGASSVVSEVPQEVTLLTGATNGTLIRSLEISNPTENAGVLTIKREDASSDEYGEFSISVASGTYIILWEDCQVFVPYNHDLIVVGDVDGIQVVANCWEI